MKMQMVMLESPYGRVSKEGTEYALRCARWCYDQGKIAIASHLYFPQFLDDEDKDERQAGIWAGFHIGSSVAEEVHFFLDLGPSAGMASAYIHYMLDTDLPFYYHLLNKDVHAEFPNNKQAPYLYDWSR